MTSTKPIRKALQGGKREQCTRISAMPYMRYTDGNERALSQCARVEIIVRLQDDVPTDGVSAATAAPSAASASP